MAPWLRIVGALGIGWNALGVVSYLAHVGLIESEMPRADMPPVVTAAYAIGVFGAVIGCLGLMLTRRWAEPVLLASLVGLIVDWSWIFAQTQQYSFVLGATVLVVSLALALLARHARRRGWLT